MLLFLYCQGRLWWDRRPGTRIHDVSAYPPIHMRAERFTNGASANRPRGLRGPLSASSFSAFVLRWLNVKLLSRLYSAQASSGQTRQAACAEWDTHSGSGRSVMPDGRSSDRGYDAKPGCGGPAIARSWTNLKQVSGCCGGSALPTGGPPTI